MYRLFALLLLSPALVSARGADDSLAQAAAPYLDEQSFAVLYADLTRLELEPVFKHLDKLGAPKKQMDEMRRTVKETLDTLAKAGIKSVFVVASMAHLPFHPPLIVMPLAPGGAGKGAVKLLLELAGMKTHEGDNVLIAGSEGGLKRFKERKPVERPEVASGFKAAGDGPVRVVLFTNSDVRRAFEELIPTLPAELGGGSSAPVTRGLRWASLGLTLTPAVNASLTIQASDEASAKAAQSIIAAAFKVLAADKGAREFLPEIEKLSALLMPKVVGDQLRVALKEEQLLALLPRILQKARESASRAVVINSYKQIGIAFHNYASANRDFFPAYASFDKQGKPLLSWRVHLLPYLEQDNLYKEFKLDEPWDSDHNKKLIKRMPKIYATSLPALAAEGRTTVVVPSGPGTGFAGKVGLKIAQIQDGTSNTILAVEADADHAVVWTKPDDLRIDPKHPVSGLRRWDARVFVALFMDGSVRTLPAAMDAKSLAALFTPDGGEVVNLP
jgi:hypothetical protein